jgi:hypothetical protein
VGRSGVSSPIEPIVVPSQLPQIGPPSASITPAPFAPPLSAPSTPAP